MDCPLSDRCDVPKGGFLYGYPYELRTLHTDAFKISRYPMTYGQFQAFVKAPDGYENRDGGRALPLPTAGKTDSTSFMPIILATT